MNDTILNKISSPSDLRKVALTDLPALAAELRRFIISIVAVKEGHLGASLGVVELTMALHYVFDTPTDRLVWDVGHQAYVHKILTGRKDVFHTNRQLGGISGFPSRKESVYDTFGVGHSSTAISAALGMAVASKLNNDNRHHVAVVGDASIASGMAFEALNHAGDTDTDLLVVLNDNAIGIDPSVGALKDYFTKVKHAEHTDENNFFEALNFQYFGPIDGHDVEKLITVLTDLKKVKGAKLLHVITTKGKGLKQAEMNQVVYHAPGKFDAETGELVARDNTELPPKFQDVFGLTLVELAEKNKDIVGITPAMPTGSSLKYMMDAFPDRAFDVGIAEQHAVTFSAGLATEGKRVFCAIYSTFLQRAYDQVIHDVCLQKLPVIFCLDRAGLVGEDGATHHGIFDLAYLNCLPNLIIAAPRNEIELRNMMYTAQLGLDLPIFIRYPRGRGRLKAWRLPMTTIEIGKGEVLKEGTDTMLVCLGTTVQQAQDAIALLPEAMQSTVGYTDMRFLKPLDEALLHQIFEQYKRVITIEDGTVTGGLGSSVTDFARRYQYTAEIEVIGIPDIFPEHGSVEELRDLVGLSAAKIKAVILD